MVQIQKLFFFGLIHQNPKAYCEIYQLYSPALNPIVVHTLVFNRLRLLSVEKYFRIFSKSTASFSTTFRRTHGVTLKTRTTPIWSITDLQRRLEPSLMRKAGRFSVEADPASCMFHVRLGGAALFMWDLIHGSSCHTGMPSEPKCRGWNDIWMPQRGILDGMRPSATLASRLGK